MCCYDCRLKALSTLLRFDGINLSPEMCFGLGEGLEFNFFIENSRRVPLIIICGRTTDTEFVALDNLKIRYKKFGGNLKSAECNESELRKILKSRPVMLTVDRYYLPYLKDKYKCSHFGLHSIVMEKELYVHDSLSDNVTRIDFKNLSLARGSDIQPFPPKYEGIVVENDLYSLNKKVVLKAIRNNMESYLFGGKGIKLLNKFINQLEFVSRQMESDHLKIDRFFKLQIKFISKYITEFESSSSFYRKIHSNFLKEASSFVGFSFTNSISCYERLGIQWHELGEILRSKSEPQHLIIRIIESLKDIAVREKGAANNLLNRCEVKGMA